MTAEIPSSYGIEHEQLSPERLSVAQDKALSILPIPSAVLSILGSGAIIYMALKGRRHRKWTPYTRLLLGLSICDVIASLTIGTTAFLRPQKSYRVWSFGNDVTCSAAGALLQFSYSAMLYSGMLSFYFLLTARYGIKNAFIAKWVEPWMHFIAIFYPLVTATVGAIMGVYSETGSGLGCYVNDFPRGCGNGPGQTECTAGKIGWYFYGLPFFATAVSLLVNNLIVSIFVCKQTRPLKQSNMQRSGVDSNLATLRHDKDSGSYDVVVDEVKQDEEEIPMSLASDVESAMGSKSGARGNASDYSVDVSRNGRAHNNKQMQRLRLVGSQAFLFVASYGICASWGGLQSMLEAMKETDQEEQAMAAQLYPILVLNAFFAPLQGFLNCIVYCRPKYLKARCEYPGETRLWAAKRAIFGDDVEPKSKGPPVEATRPVSGNKNSDEKEDDPEAGGGNSTTNRLPREMISSLTAIIGDFDHGLQEGEEDERWDGTSGGGRRDRHAAISSKMTSKLRSSVHSSGSSLEVISEISEFVFEPIVLADVPQVEHDNNSRDAHSSSQRTFQTPVRADQTPATAVSSESRWNSSSPTSSRKRRTPAALEGSTAPAQVLPPLSPAVSESRWSAGSVGSPELARRKNSLTLDLPMPRRVSNENTDSADAAEEGPYSNSQSSSSGSTTVDDISQSSDTSVDAPVRAPERKLSPTPQPPL